MFVQRVCAWAMVLSCSMAVVHAQVPPPIPVALPPPAATSDGMMTSHRCRVRVFLEPSLHVIALSYSDRPYFLKPQSVAGAVIARFHGGVHLDECFGRTDVRVAALMMFTNLSNLEDQFGFGGEVEVSVPLVEHWKIGPRLGVETATPITHISAGARLRYKRAAWVGIDIFHDRPGENQSFPPCTDRQIGSCNANVTGITIGGGYGGKLGVATGAVTAGLFLLAIAAYAGAGS